MEGDKPGLTLINIFLGVIFMLESKFKSNLKKEIEVLFPDCILIDTDPTQCQGFPDLLILFRNHWACLETKRNSNSTFRPNQKYYIDLLDSMSFSRTIFPENKKEVLNDLQQAFSS